MSTRLTITSNADSVISDIEDVKGDIRHEFRKRVGAAMRVLWADARQYVLNDPHHTGDLFQSIRNDSDTGGRKLSFRVFADMRRAEHAAIVEFGSGSRSNVPYDTSAMVPPDGPGSARPIGYPFEAPDIDYNEDNPLNTSNSPTFYGFVKHIEEWMRTKPVTPLTGDYFASAALIASTIIERGTYAHPYLRPAWFDNELAVKRAARNALRNAVR